jgi:Lipocalin-like domain
MNRRSILSISAMTALGLSLLPGSALAQQKSLKDQLVGTWTLASWEQTNEDGSKLQRYGSNPKGYNIFDANGRFFMMFARPDLPKIASGNPASATPEEAKAIVAGVVSYFGTYTVDEASKSITLRVEASSLPNQLGVDQKRTITSLTANELQISNPVAVAGGQINYAMKRAK